MFILINKPSGPTSHDIINTLRRITSIERIGHAGTLDPLASGLLLCAIGRASTRLLNKFLKSNKTYLATLKLGATSDTYDRTGRIIVFPYLGEVVSPACITRDKPEGYHPLTKKLISSTLKNFIGSQLQTPPVFSAKKIHGQAAYKLARQGKTVSLQPKEITIFDLQLKTYSPLTKTLKIEVCCSSGTYIRSLAHDLGQALGCGAYLEELVRTQIGKYSLKNAITLDQLTLKNWQKYCF